MGAISHGALPGFKVPCVTDAVPLRGVVQLFNAVRKHQKTIDDKVKEVGGSERKKAKLLSSVSKKDFIDVLRRTEGGSKTEKVPVSSAVQSEPVFFRGRSTEFVRALSRSRDSVSSVIRGTGTVGRSRWTHVCV